MRTMQGDDGAGSSSYSTQNIGLGKKSGGRFGTKSSGSQRSWSSQDGRSMNSGKPNVWARKSSKKVDEPVQSVLRGQDMSSSRDTNASSNDLNRQVNVVAGLSGIRMKSTGSGSSLQPILRTKASRTPVKSTGSTPSGTNAIPRSSNYSRDDFQRPEQPFIDLTEQPGSSQHRSSLVLSSPWVNRNQPNRKITQNYGETPSVGRRLSVIMPSDSVALPAKSGAMKPHWQLDDEERAMEQETLARTDPADRDFIKRVGSARRPTATSHHHFKHAPKHLKSYVGRHLKLRKQGEPESESDSDSPMEIDGPFPPRKTVWLQQAGVKAARKREWPQKPLFDPDSSDEDELVDEVDELDSSDSTVSDKDQYSYESVDDSDIEEIVIAARRQRSLSPAEIEILPGPPRPPSPLSISEDMMKAINGLSLSSVRMQSTHQLPFLRRNLRRGFRKRCCQLGVPTEPTHDQETRLRVQYEYGSEIAKARLRVWVCPLCELHGLFPSREMLACHLSWDHEKALTKWSQYQSGGWHLRLTITNPPAGLVVEDEHGIPPTPSLVVRQQQTDISSPFPFVTLSPPEPQPVPVSPNVRVRTRDSSSPLVSTKARLWDSPTPFPSTSQASRLLMTSETSVPLSSRDPSATAVTTTTTATTATMATTSTTSAQRPRDTRYPPPPPPGNPLGPAAQPPYLPAKSEYGGPDIYYSCRPGGACLYDLLNTLPLEPYGVLAWEVLDREDEIYDSDNVRDEYKVMHALWGRWIFLNRNTFIKDYYKGIKAFIDFYWRMIHRAAGWDALRYWLLMLVVNRFITGAEVASLLKYYESLTGMDTWYT